VAYAVCFGVRVEQRHPGWGWDAGPIMLGIAAVSLGLGLVVRRLLRTRDERRVRVGRLVQENAEIRAVERARLADDLQTVVTRGLATIEQHLETAARRPADLDTLRGGLDRVDGDSRSLLAELRVLLGILRRDPVADVPPAPRRAGPRRWA
jgi:signal transduction histidine kinase